MSEIKCAECSKVPTDPIRRTVIELNNGKTGREWRHREFFCNDVCVAKHVTRRSAEREYPTQVVED